MTVPVVTPRPEVGPHSEAAAQVAAAIAAGRRHATLSLSARRKPTGWTEDGPAYGAQLTCGDFSVWLDDPAAADVVAFVLDVGSEQRPTLLP